MTTPGDFSTLPIKEYEKEMFSDAYNAVSSLNLWDWLSRTDVPGDSGFMFSMSDQLIQINDNMKFTGHSGSSFGYTMRVMEKIAKKGWDSYVKEVIYRAACPCRRAVGRPGWCGVAGFGVPACEH